MTHLQCTNLHRFIASNLTSSIWQSINKTIKNNQNKTHLKSNTLTRLEALVELEVAQTGNKISPVLN